MTISLRRNSKKFVLISLLALAMLLFTAVAVSPTMAAKGGGHGKGGSTSGGTTTTYSGTCAATPNPAKLWDYVTISGSGAAPNTYVGYSLTFSGGSAFGWVTSDANGKFALRYMTFVSGGTKATFGTVASCSFQVN